MSTRATAKEHEARKTRREHLQRRRRSRQTEIWRHDGGTCRRESDGKTLDIQGLAEHTNRLIRREVHWLALACGMTAEQQGEELKAWKPVVLLEVGETTYSPQGKWDILIEYRSQADDR